MIVYDIDTGERLEAEPPASLAEATRVWREAVCSFDQDAGEWVAYDGAGRPLGIPVEADTGGWDASLPHPISIEVSYVHAYTPEELEAIREDGIAGEQAIAEAEREAAALKAAPARLDALEAAQDDVILLLADIVGGAI